MKGGASKVVAVACGVGCAVCVALYTQGVSQQAAQDRAEALERFGGEQVSVCVAKSDLVAGRPISGSDVEVRPWVVSLLPDDPVFEVAEAAGMIPASTILAGEVVSHRRFDAAEDALSVPDGLVALSVPAKDVQVVGGAVAAGNRVDVYATGASSTQLIGQQVPVLSTSVDAGESDGGLSWITLALAPDRVQEVVAAAQTAQLYFALPGQDAVGPASQTHGPDPILPAGEEDSAEGGR